MILIGCVMLATTVALCSNVVTCGVAISMFKSVTTGAIGVVAGNLRLPPENEYCPIQCNGDEETNQHTMCRFTVINY